jgi:hypothetical protein
MKKVRKTSNASVSTSGSASTSASRKNSSRSLDVGDLEGTIREESGTDADDTSSIPPVIYDGSTGGHTVNLVSAVLPVSSVQSLPVESQDTSPVTSCEDSTQDRRCDLAGHSTATASRALQGSALSYYTTDIPTDLDIDQDLDPLDLGLQIDVSRDALAGCTEGARSVLSALNSALNSPNKPEDESLDGSGGSQRQVQGEGDLEVLRASEELLQRGEDKEEMEKVVSALTALEALEVEVEVEAACSDLNGVSLGAEKEEGEVTDSNELVAASGAHFGADSCQREREKKGEKEMLPEGAEEEDYVTVHRPPESGCTGTIGVNQVGQGENKEVGEDEDKAVGTASGNNEEAEEEEEEEEDEEEEEEEEEEEYEDEEDEYEEYDEEEEEVEGVGVGVESIPQRGNSLPTHEEHLHEDDVSESEDEIIDIEPGTLVKVMRKKKWRSAIIKKQHRDGTYKVVYRDGSVESYVPFERLAVPRGALLAATAGETKAF